MTNIDVESPVAELVTDGFRGNQDEADPNTLWRLVESLGIDRLGLPEELGGSGGDLADAAVAVRLAGYFALPVPLAETLLVAGWALAQSGRDVASGPLALVRGPDLAIRARRGAGWALAGHAHDVPWGRLARILVVYADGLITVVPPSAAHITERDNMAGEPRDTVSFDAVPLSETDVCPAPADVSEEEIRRRGALGRAIAISGALERLLALTVDHSLMRSQFGGPIGRFQAIQQSIAILAAEVAAARAAVDRAVAQPSDMNIAMAKIRAGEAATIVCRTAHQVHGAVGLTREHRLQRLSRRAWAWRDEHGSEEEWAAWLGAFAAGHGAAALWPSLTSGG
jgi:acyl-CoA dehydrogenase